MSKDLEMLLSNPDISELKQEYNLTDSQYREYVSSAFIRYRKVLPKIKQFKRRVRLCILADRNVVSRYQTL